ncbi:MAG TPA: transglycosylase domain-containing protein [Candidatus Dormibacteraeota bacterium]|nr:transglycosylase domain-containing protein [Candidatus Dormibacteraeota bacterium]
MRRRGRRWRDPTWSRHRRALRLAGAPPSHHLLRAGTRLGALFRTAVALAGKLTLLAVALSGVVAAGFAGLPGIDAAVAQPLPSDTLIYDRTGQVLLGDLHPPGYQHYEQALSGMGRYLPEATVAIEDARFWSEPGVDVPSLVRAALTDVRRRAVVEGGSTITQQLVKARLAGPAGSLARKFREAALADRLSYDLPRQRILELYLNAIPYGNTAYGAQAAAQIYFHRDASTLDLAQAALLAGLPQDPTLLDPLRHWPVAKARQRQVLDAMVRAGNVTAGEAADAYAEDLSPPDHLFGPAAVDVARQFVDYVAGQLAPALGRERLLTGGLRVVTSLDWGVQQVAQEAVAAAVAANGPRGVSDGALVAMDPRTGQVLAMVGSAGPGVAGGQYNLAVWPPRNPGSSFKVFTYTTAIESRLYTMLTPIQDAPLTVSLAGQQAYTPVDYDGRDHGVCALQACLGNSLNIPAVRVELGVGISSVVRTARLLAAPPYRREADGRFNSDDPPSSYGPSLTLGGYGETPLQMATAVSALASGGVLHRPVSALEVIGPRGAPVYRPTDGEQRVLDAGTAFIVSQMLSDPGNRTLIFGPSTPLTLRGRHAAAKTGTTDDFTDGWTVGYTPSLAAAVWMGNADARPMVPGSDGIFVAAPAWNAFMQGALDWLDRGDDWYQVPPGVVTATVGGHEAYFLAGTAPPAA